MATLVEQILDIFRQFDTRGEGTVTRTELFQVLQTLDASIWKDEQIDVLLQAYGVEGSGKLNYESLIKWIMGAPDGPLMGDPVCQAAYDGSLLTLKEHLSSKGIAGVSRAVGYVLEGDQIVGMCTEISHQFQLKPLREDPNMLPASALQWAAFGGHAHVVKFLTGECGMKRDDPSTFGWAPSSIATSHRLNLDGDVVVDDGEATHLLEDEEHAPLCAALLKKMGTKRELAEEKARA